MVLNNVTKFHKILIKSIRVRKRTSLGQTYVRTYGRTDRGNTLCPGHCHGRGIKKFTRFLECHTIWVNNNKMFGLIWVKSFGKGYQQMPLVELSRPKDFSVISTCIESGLIFYFCLNTPDRWQSKALLTTDKRGSKIATNTVFLTIFI